jgi:hypothetical protein
MLESLEFVEANLSPIPRRSADHAFARAVRDGWTPRHPASESELVTLRPTTVIRGTCCEPLLRAGDIAYVDHSAIAEPGDLVSFAVSARFAERQNDCRMPGQPTWRPGDRWMKLFTMVHGLECLMDNLGEYGTATLMAGESPEAAVHLAPLRNIRRAGKLLFNVVDTTQINLNATSSVASAQSATTVNVTGINGTTVNQDIISLTVTTFGSPMAIDAGSSIFAGAANGNSLNPFNVSIYRDGTLVSGTVWDPTNGGSAPITSTSILTSLQTTLSVVDFPSAGTHTYTLHCTMLLNHVSGTVLGFANFSNNFIKVREYKR